MTLFGRRLPGFVGFSLAGFAACPAGLFAPTKGLRTIDPLGAGIIKLVAQTTHEAAALSGDLGRVERQPLGLGHAHRDRREARQPTRATKPPPAVAAAALEVRGIAYADLPELDPSAQFPFQTSNQFSKVDALVRNEIEGATLLARMRLRADEAQGQIEFLGKDARRLKPYCAKPLEMRLPFLVRLRGPPHDPSDRRALLPGEVERNTRNAAEAGPTVKLGNEWLVDLQIAKRSLAGD